MVPSNHAVHPQVRGKQPMQDKPGIDVPLAGKDGLSPLGEVPLVAETPEEFLDDETTPVARFFVRNNGLLPEPVGDAESWTFTVDGEVERPLNLTLSELKKRFSQKTFRMVLECGGNGRSFFEPKAEGNPWTNGGVGCAEWTGVSLSDVSRVITVPIRTRPEASSIRPCPAACRSPKPWRSIRCWFGR
jgi:DMSO/TMAO reductase YedYZ molybdopterin-dependent catalytic subunit